MPPVKDDQENQDEFTKAMLGNSDAPLPEGVEFVASAPAAKTVVPPTPPPATPAPQSVPTPQPAPEAPAPKPAKPAEPEKPLDERELARMAMEGPERTAKRKEEEHETVVKTEVAKIDKRLAEIAKIKDKLELAWIDLDNKRQAIKQTLDPIKAKEKDIESQETTIEEEESRQPFPKEKRAAEEKRWQIQESRHQIEAEKWQVEQRLTEVEEKIAANTAEYQKALDEEDGLKVKEDDLKREI